MAVRKATVWLVQPVNTKMAKAKRRAKNAMRIRIQTNKEKLPKRIVLNVPKINQRVQAWATPKQPLVCAAKKTITNKIPVCAKHAPTAPTAASKMVLVCRNWWPSMGFGEF